MVVDGTYLPKMDGIVVSITNAVKYLTENGHEIVIVAPKYKDYEDEKQKNITIYRFKSFSAPSYPEVRIPIPNLRKFRKIVKAFHPDIIHTHTPATLGIMALICARQYNIPIISTYHTSFPDMLVYISPIKLLKLDKVLDKLSDKSGKIDLVEVQNKVKEFVMKSKITQKHEELSRKTVLKITNQFYNRHDLVIAPSKRIEQDLLTHDLKAKTVVISNGIHIDKFTKKKSYNKFPRFLHVGRVAFEKKIDVVIDAMNIVSKRYPKSILTITGDGPALTSLKKQVVKSSLRKNIIFTGFIQRDKLPKIYRDHDVFITASEMETQGLVLLEAMASGLPVIGVDVLAIPEVVHDNKTGYLVEKRDSVEIAKKMIELIHNPELVEKMGKNARKKSEEHDVNLCAKKLEKTYFLLKK